MATPGRRYINGHNSTGRRLSAEARANIADAKRGAGNPQYGKRPANYNGGFRHTDGYLMVHAPDHPFSGVKGYVLAHRLVVEQHLREHHPGSPFLIRVDRVAYLRPEIEVHHINEIKDDNRIENLQPMTKAEHCALHREALTRGRWPNRLERA